MRAGKRLYMVIPCYNEEEVLELTAKTLSDYYDQLIAADQISRDSRILFVNDGSKDHTWSLIKQLHAENPRFSGLDLTRNRGHQNALLAGLMAVKDRCDISISMDADLQDDIAAIGKMIAKNAAGANIVYGVRNDRQSDSFFKRFTAEAYYKILNALSGEIVYNHADFRLMDRRALEELSHYEEVNLFLRGIVPMLGLTTATVSYERHERAAGESKYPLTKMLALAIEGITSLSTKPIKWVTLLGLTISGISLLALLYTLIQHALGHTIAGWSSTVVSIWFLGGLQLLAIGVIGEYIGKIYLETKHRPRFAIRQLLDEPGNETQSERSKQ